MNLNRELDQLYIQINDLRDKDFLDDKDIAALKRLAQHQDSGVRYDVAEILVNADAAQAEDILVPMLNDKDYLVRLNACDSLCISANPQVIELLKEIIARDKAGLVRFYAVLTIGDIALNINANRQELLEFLEQRLLCEKNMHTKIAFFRTMFLLGKEQYLQHLIEQLKTKNYRNRCATVKSLADIVNNSNKAEIVAALEELQKVEETVAVHSSLEQVLGDL